MQPSTDHLLITTLKNGSEFAFTEIYNRFYPRLHMEANYLLHDKDEAADLVQEVFVNMWIRRDELPENIFLKSYLSTCLRNKCLDRMRRINRHQKKVKVYAGNIEEYTQHVPIEHKELFQQILTAINELPLAQRQVFEMAYLEDRSHREIMEAKGTSLQTIKNQISTTLKVLRKKLKSASLE
ncbi:sigma-70 family RNA polymerase sigma factor [Chitinophaga sp. MM2321]|uniref:RNA polymerase sigma factor n=1 Tax=Chitinophaga sp. MM2321 TaxID=3137178 RepID=UPI0032D59CB2